MLRSLLIASFAVFAISHCFAQPPGQSPISSSTTIPSGACSGTVGRLVGPGGTIYTCQNGTWGTAISGGGSGGGTPSPGFSPNQVISGCGVDYTSGLSFTVGACTYQIAGVTYNIPTLTTVTLAAADPSNPRLDMIIVNTSSTATNLTGTAAATPAAPTPDATTQLPLAIALVPANGTTPSNITVTNLYLENTEWTCSSSSNINCASTNNPYQGTKDIEATSAVLTNNFTLVKPLSGTVDLATVNYLILYIRSKGQWPTGNGGANAARSLTLQWENGSTLKGNQIVLKDGQFGFSSSITTSYQQVSIPTGLFGINGVAVTTLVATVSGTSGSSSIGWYIDNVTLQVNSNGTTSSLPNTVTVASGTAVMNTSAISSAACATVVTVAAGGVLSTDTVIFTPNQSIKALTGFTPAITGGLTIAAYPTANNVNFDECNWSTGSITPSSHTLNWRVTR